MECRWGNDYTYEHSSLGHRSWLDFGIASKSLNTSCLSVMNAYDNFSDHRPISFVVEDLCCTADQRYNLPSGNHPPTMRVKWTEDTIEAYYWETARLIESFNPPLVECSCVVQGCKDKGHIDSIMSAYGRLSDLLVQAVKRSSALRKKAAPSGCVNGRRWWNSELTELKRKAQEAYRVFRNDVSTEVKERWQTAKRAYKYALRAAK